MTILVGLRGLIGESKREAKKMPITEDIMNHGLIGPMIRKSMAWGRAEGQMEILLAQIEKPFGAVPARIRKRLTELKPAQMRTVSLRLLDAARVDDLFPR